MANSPSLSLVRDQARPKKLGRYELEECLATEGGLETYRARVRGGRFRNKRIVCGCRKPSPFLPNSSMVERTAVNGMVIGSSPI